VEHDPLLSSFKTLSGRVGILGGSFDPVHIGHLMAARVLTERLALKSCIFVPAHRNPLKASAPQASDRERLEMLRIALRAEPRLYVSPLELRLDEAEIGPPSYTVDTLQIIRAGIAAETQLFLLMGSDLLPELYRWKEAGRIFEICSVVPFAREGHPIEAFDAETMKLAPAQVQALEQRLVFVPACPVSASGVRDRIRRGEDAGAELPPGVGEFVAARRLYQYS
jgi:nicotinate-nucleotide adenylyltransferase